MARLWKGYLTGIKIDIYHWRVMLMYILETQYDELQHARVQITTDITFTFDELSWLNEYEGNQLTKEKTGI